jgi:DNA-directed RNA polymerase specialized sigma24 family protein
MSRRNRKKAQRRRAAAGGVAGASKAGAQGGAQAGPKAGAQGGPKAGPQAGAQGGATRAKAARGVGDPGSTGGAKAGAAGPSGAGTKGTFGAGAEAAAHGPTVRRSAGQGPRAVRSPGADPRAYRPVAATIASPQAASRPEPRPEPDPKPELKAEPKADPEPERKAAPAHDEAPKSAGTGRGGNADADARREGDRLARRAEAAFDRLYERTAGDLLRQAEVLTGDLAVARRAVAYAFDMAWQRWPEVARDSDPVGWVRAAVHDYALSPWQRWLPGSRAHPLRPSSPLETALLELPPGHRRALLLYDGLGLDLPEAAVENEATTATMAARIMHAREEIVMAAPDLLEPDGADLPARLGALLDVGPDAEPPERPAGVRDASERGVRNRTLGAYALTGLIALVTLVAVLTTGAGGGAGTHRSGHHGSGSGHARGSDAPEDAAGPGNATGPGNAAGQPPFGEPARDVLP